MYRLRLRLARLIAPVPIMVDPFPDGEMVAFVRDGSTQAVFKLKTFTIATTQPSDRHFGDPKWFEYDLKPVRTFSGEMA